MAILGKNSVSPVTELNPNALPKAAIRWQPAAITRIVHNTPRVTSFWFKPREKFAFSAGQHVDIRLTAPDGTVLEHYTSEVAGRGMEYEALAAEEIIASGRIDGDVLPIDETVAIMGTLDEVRAQIGLRYPGEG